MRANVRTRLTLMTPKTHPERDMVLLLRTEKEMEMQRGAVPRQSGWSWSWNCNYSPR